MYALIENGAIKDRRVEPLDVGDWRPLVVERMGSGDDADTIEQVRLIIEDDRVRQVFTYVPRDLESIKTELSSAVDAEAERQRLRYIAPGSGMAMTYREKFEQAQAVEDLGEAGANALSEADAKAQFPTLAASIGIEAATLWDCAQLVIAKYEAWAAVSFEIERARLSAKKSIRDASDAAAARAAYEAITWPKN